jgi:hypothetical protein
VLDTSHPDGVDNDECEILAMDKRVVLWRSESKVTGTLSGVEGVAEWAVVLCMRKAKVRDEFFRCYPADAVI